MLDFVHIIIVLLAGIIYTIVAIATDTNAIVWCYNLIIILISFWVIGYFFKRYLIKNIFNDKMIESNVNIANDESDEENQEINIDDEEIKENESFFESLGDE